MPEIIERIADLLPEAASIADLLNSNVTEVPPEGPAPVGNQTEEPTTLRRKSAPGGFAGIPAKPAVYVCFSAEGVPVVVATTANLRKALQNRMAGEAESKRNHINYAEFVQTIRFRCVGSAFAASWWYYRSVRSLFPSRYAAMLAWKPAWFITLDPAAEVPQFQISTAPCNAPAVCVGPLLSRRAARELMESIEDLFDLCRYRDILRQAPHGTACTYKELGRCPAPCDGTISMTEYQRQTTAARHFLADDADARIQWCDQQEALMRQAASRMDFRLAATYKRKLDLADKLNRGKLPQVHNMDKWKYLIFQRGKTRQWIAPFVAGPGWVAELPEVPESQVNEHLLMWTQLCNPGVSHCIIWETFPIEQVAALVTYHKYRPADAGLYIPMDGTIGIEIIFQALHIWLNHENQDEMPEMNSTGRPALLSPGEPPEL